MNGQLKSKLNQLLKNIPQGGVATQRWLKKYDIYRQLAESYCKSGWLRKIGHGACARQGDNISWTGGLYAIQQQLELPIHAGARTALERKGLVHFLPLGKGTLFLFGKPSATLPKWFREYDWGVDIHYSILTLFDSDAQLGLTEEAVDQYTIKISSPERSIMEILHFVPKDESFESAQQLMEGLTTLRPQLVQELLEKCQSVKVVRLFLFLAEECGHDWVDDLDTSRMNLGGGKRVIVHDGRLDPVYNITVANAPFTHPKRQMQELQNRRKKSPAIRLMCPKRGTRLTYDKEHGYFGSMLYLAFSSGDLPSLDSLLKEFRIAQRGSKDFQKRLKEHWLPQVSNGDLRKIRCGSNNTFSALIELMVAQHLRKSRAKILNLEAWEQKSRGTKVPDISYKDKSGKLWNAEIKYVDQSPELQENIVDQLRTGIPQIRAFGDGEFVNYYFGRIAEAALQLENGRHDHETRQVWLVFHAAANFERSIFEKNYLKHPPHWFQNTQEQKDILKMFGTKIAGRSPSEWLGETSEIVLATSNSWTLENIKTYQTKELLK